MSKENLDKNFYRYYYLDLADFTDEELVKHWLKFGSAEGRFPTAEAAVRLHLRLNDLPTQFDAADYLYLNKDLDSIPFRQEEAILHYLDFGIMEDRIYKRLDQDIFFIADFKDLVRSGLVNIRSDARLTPKSLRQMLYLNGLRHYGFVKHFDHNYYLALQNVYLPKMLTQSQRNIVSLDHFVGHGIAIMAPIAENLHFDSVYYKASNNFDFTVSDVSLFCHWLQSHDDDADGKSPNMAHYIGKKYRINWQKGAFNLDIYRFCNKDLEKFSTIDLVIHILEHGILEQRASTKPEEKNIKIVTELADGLSACALTSLAEKLYLRAVHFVPYYGRLNQHLGDLLLRGGRAAEAVVHYGRNVEAGIGNKWSYINASSCYEQLGDLTAALAITSTACRIFPEDEGFRRRRKTFADKYFWEEYDLGRAEALAGRIDSCHDRLFAAASACDVQLETEFASHRSIKTVGLFANVDLPQCTLYRVEQKIEQLLAAGYKVRFYNGSTDVELLEQSLNVLDAVIFYRVAAFPQIVRCINAVRAAGLVSFYEIDDLIFDSVAYPEPFEDYAGQVSWEEYVGLCTGVPLFRYAATLCDYGITSTPALARHLGPLVRKSHAFVHRNALGLRHEKAVARARTAEADPDVVTIFYGSGTKAHKLDLERILFPALQAIHERYGSTINIVMMGHKPLGSDYSVVDRITFEPFTSDIDVYWDHLSRADINLAVLRSSPATDAKSEIKWLEAAMFAIPSVLSSTETYSEVVDNGLDGLLCTTSDEFTDALSRLVEDRSLRKRIGLAAKTKAQLRYREPELTANLRSLLDSIEVATPAQTRVLVVNVFYPPQTIGGATRVMVDNIKDLSELFPGEFEFEVFTTLEGGEHPYSIRVASHDGIRTTAMVAGNHPDLTPLDERAGAVFERCVERFAPHIIHFHCTQRMTASVVEVALRRGIPYVITMHDGWWISDQQFLYDGDGEAKLYDFKQPFTYTNNKERSKHDRALALLPALEGAAAVLSVSEPFARVLAAANVPSVIVNANGLPRISTRPPQARTKNSKADGKVVVAHIGGTEPHKGFQLFKYAIQAAAPRNLTVLVVDHSLSKGDERFEDWNGMEVRFIPKCQQDEVAFLYDDIDVLFAPSLWPESFGLVTREAIAAGCWVVASDRGAIAEPIIEDVNGHIVSVDSIKDLLMTVRKIDADPKLYLAKPDSPVPTRSSKQQAEELKEIYFEISRSYNQ